MENDNRNHPASYFEFDDASREILIKRYDTPTPWMNYFSNGVFHTMMSQAGGALAFHKSPQIWRINRYRFFHLPTDRSGLYYYIRDRKTGMYWCPTAEPAQHKPVTWEARHGLGYTVFSAESGGIKAELTYFVGRWENCIIWNLKLMNLADKIIEADVFAFVEFGMMEFMRELSWVCYNKHQLSVDFDKIIQAIVYHYSVEMQPRPQETPLVYFASDRTLGGYDGDRDEFIGTYRSESNPWAIEHGGCTNSLLKGGDPCGALQIPVRLAPGRTETINTFLGTAMTSPEVNAALGRCRRPGFVDESLHTLKTEWEDYLDHFRCEIPDADAQRMINIWNPYQAQRNFMFSRNISYYATGTFRGTGYRDTAQDVLSQTPIQNQEAKIKTLELLGQQYQDGHTNHYYFPHEGWEPLRRLHSDNHIWPILAVWNIIMEDGELDFLDQKVPFYDGGEATVYEHLCRSVEFTKSHLGANGFPLMLTSDWNDMLYKVCREGRGESIWMSMFLGYALPKLAELARLLGKEKDAGGFMEFRERQKILVNSIAWDGKWFRRATMDNGDFLGTAGMDEAKIFLNTQSWSVLSGMAEHSKMIRAMDSVKELLDTDLGIRKIWPSIVNFPTPEDPLSHYHKGCGENGAIFCHANTWAIIAECMLGRAEIAWKYFRQLIPKVAMEKAGAWRYKAEPYVYASNFFGPDSDRFGLANVSWLTGTASWMYLAATQHILGIRPTWEGLLVDPCMPLHWDEVKISRVFRKVRYNIEMKRETKQPKEVKQLFVNKKPIQGNVVPFEYANREVNVLVIM
jgi:cellobiose phosphorylase